MLNGVTIRHIVKKKAFNIIVLSLKKVDMALKVSTIFKMLVEGVKPDTFEKLLKFIDNMDMDYKEELYYALKESKEPIIKKLWRNLEKQS